MSTIAGGYTGWHTYSYKAAAGCTDDECRAEKPHRNNYYLCKACTKDAWFKSKIGTFNSGKLRINSWSGRYDYTMYHIVSTLTSARGVQMTLHGLKQKSALEALSRCRCTEKCKSSTKNLKPGAGTLKCLPDTFPSSGTPAGPSFVRSSSGRPERILNNS